MSMAETIEHYTMPKKIQKRLEEDGREGCADGDEIVELVF